MRFLLTIITILLFAECSNLIQVFQFTDAELVLAYDSESEEEKKAETEKEVKKFDKYHSWFECSIALSFFTWHKQMQHPEGLCLKGHCALIDQPPEMRL